MLKSFQSKEEESENTDCRICQKPNASKYNHYGANYVCSSCRAFFMRAITCDLYKTFAHNAKQTGKQCIIESIGRKSCKKCRFDKCLEAGMNIKYVNKQTYAKPSKPNEVIAIQPTNYFVEKEALEKVFDIHWASSYQITFDCYSKSPKIFVDHICQTQTCISTDEFLKFAEYLDSFCIRNLANLLAHHSEIEEDIKYLLKVNSARVSNFYFALMFLDDWSDPEEFIEYGRQNRDKSVTINELMTLYDTYGKKTGIQLQYKNFFASPWAEHSGIEEEHKLIYERLQYWYLKLIANQTYKLDKCLMILMHLVFLYNSDGGIEKQLKHPQKVKELHEHYCKLLHKYIKSIHKAEVANVLFGKGLMLIHETQRAHELSLQRLKI